MENGSTTYVGLDVHQERIFVSMLIPGKEKAEEFQVGGDAKGIRKMSRLLLQVGTDQVECAYEAGPSGYTLQRQLESSGIGCMVAAPSLIAKKAGDRIKTDRRDARKLAEHLRAGLLTAVCPPSESQESVRDLCRCREDAREDLMRARHRLTKMLLRRGLVFREGKNWTLKYRRWLASLELTHKAERVVFDDYLQAVEALEERLHHLEVAMEAESQKDPYREPVARLRCLRGFATVSALTVVAELHDAVRFHSPRKLMAYLGLVPSEHSSGTSRRQGAITKAGNRHVRRILVAAAWHYRHRPGVGAALRKRREGQPGAIISLADRAQRRLHRRFVHLALDRGKSSQKTVVAVARELTGFLWDILVLYPARQEVSS